MEIKGFFQFEIIIKLAFSASFQYLSHVSTAITNILFFLVRGPS